MQQLAGMNLQQVFSLTYQHGWWGSNRDRDFYSGSGSHDTELVEPYLEQLRKFITSLPQPPVIVDLGCGDFNIGRQLLDLAGHYHGCDLVAELIDYLRHHHKHNDNHERLSFHCLDATSETLPGGDILLVRQVLQHLDNASIAKILRHFGHYRYIIITEHVPAGAFAANLDKPAGPDNRMRFNSGVDLQKPPFSLQTFNHHRLCSVKTSAFPGNIDTWLLTPRNPVA